MAIFYTCFLSLGDPMTAKVPRPIAFVMASSNHGTMLVNRHDYRMTPQGGYGVGFQILNKAEFDQEEVGLVLQILDARRKNFGDGVVALDCGANIGVHTIEWARHMHGWGEVCAFEAQERIYYALAGNIAMNNCFNARAMWAAVGASDGEIRVPSPDYHVPSSFGSLEIRPKVSNEFIGQVINYSSDHTIPTRMLAIDSLGLDRLDFIKIDIEGMEVEALSGASDTIKKFKPIMLVERIKSDDVEITQLLAEHGYKIFNIGINLLAVSTADPLCERIVIN